MILRLDFVVLFRLIDVKKCTSFTTSTLTCFIDQSTRRESGRKVQLGNVQAAKVLSRMFIFLYCLNSYAMLLFIFYFVMFCYSVLLIVMPNPTSLADCTYFPYIRG